MRTKSEGFASNMGASNYYSAKRYDASTDGEHQ